MSRLAGWEEEEDDDEVIKPRIEFVVNGYEEWYEQHVQAGKYRPDKKAEGYGVKRPAALAHKGGNPFRKESGAFKEKPTIEDRERDLNEKEEGDSKGGLPITKEPCVSKAKPHSKYCAGNPDKQAEAYGGKGAAATGHKGANPLRKEMCVFKVNIEDRSSQPDAKAEGAGSKGPAASETHITNEPCVFNATPSIEDRASHPEDYMTDLYKVIGHGAKRRKSALNWHHPDYNMTNLDI